MMVESALVVTDSGGIQEEACAMGKPTLVLRNVTERQEGVVSGATRVIGTRAEDIVREVTRLLSDRAALRALARSTPCFGDGRAAERIVGAVRHVFLNGKRPLDFDLVLARRGAARGNGHGARGTGRRTAAVPAPIPH
jgi:UDP-N-acetylglucosamine 2-epimerase (non-hydrolysing)